MVGLMRVRFVRPRPTVLAGLNVSIGKINRPTLRQPLTGLNKSFKSFNGKSDGNLSRFTLRLLNGSGSVGFEGLVDGFFFVMMTLFVVSEVRSPPISCLGDSATLLFPG